MNDYTYAIEIKVRDYELDAEGVVNNANYLHYLEYTRHEFCEYVGFSFKQMQEQGVDPMVRRVEIDYKQSLRSGDTMVSKLWVEMKGAQAVFHHKIVNKATGAVCTTADVYCVCLKDKKLTRGEVFIEAFKDYLR